MVQPYVADQAPWFYQSYGTIYLFIYLLTNFLIKHWYGWAELRQSMTAYSAHPYPFWQTAVVCMGMLFDTDWIAFGK